MTLDPLAVARAIADELEAAAIAYAIGGALAYGYWGAPRGTVDVDIDVFDTGTLLEPVFAALERAGVVVVREAAGAAVRERGDFRGHHGGMRVDVFVAFDEYHQAVRDRRVCVDLLGRPAWILSAEDTIIFKVLFDRPKDWVDIERVVALRGKRLDHAYVSRWLAHWLGGSDPRSDRLSQLLARYES